MADIHVIVISSVRPEPSSAGQMILYRHLAGQPGITFEVYGNEPTRLSWSSVFRRIVAKLGGVFTDRFIQDIWVAWNGRWIDPDLPLFVSDPKSTIVLTVAHGDGFMAAWRFAQRHGLPLVTFFHDWWPDIPKVSRLSRKVLERRFRSLYRFSTVSFCVCEGMMRSLGPHQRSLVLPPIATPEKRPCLGERENESRFRICYAGNLAEYGPMIGDALEESLSFPDIFLQVRGSNPSWSTERCQKMRDSGHWLEFARAAELLDWLATFDAFLVPMVFDVAMRRRMETSFPSKLIEFAQFGKPIIVWGPDYCSAVQWAKNSRGALCVVDRDPKVLFSSVQQFRKYNSLRTEVSRCLAHSTLNEFSPDQIQRRFVDVMKSLAGTPERSGVSRTQRA